MARNHADLLAETLRLLLALRACLAGGISALPSYDEVRAAWTSTEGVLLDRHGEAIHELRVDMHGRRLDWVPLSEVSPAFVQTVIRAEDKRFYEHGGVDWLALGDAALDSLFSSAHARRQHAVDAGRCDARGEPQDAARSIARSGRNGTRSRPRASWRRAWSKRQILEAYLNLSTFRGELQGVGAAARALFGKQPSGLDERESLLLAVLLRGPERDARDGGQARLRTGRVDASLRAPATGWTRWRTQALAGAPNLRPAAALAPHVARACWSRRRRAACSRLWTARCRRSRWTRCSGSSPRSASSTSPMRRCWWSTTPAARCWPTSATPAPSRSARYVDGVQAARQAGSTLKPFLYELAIEQRLLTAASLLDDSPVNSSRPAGCTSRRTTTATSRAW